MRDKILIFLFMSIILGLPIIILIRPQKDFSSLENRNLVKVKDLKNNDVFNNELQDNLENVLSDQMILGQSMKLYYNFFKNVTGVKVLEQFYKNKEKNALIPLGITEDSRVYRLNKSNYLVYGASRFEDYKDKLDLHIKNINEISRKFNVDINVFYINKDVDINCYDTVNNYMETNLKKNIKYSSLFNANIDNYYEEYKNYFYKTDHHWNYKGSYEGYKIISNMLENDILNYKKENCFSNVKFIGSKGKKIGDFLNYDDFCAYEFDIEKNDVYINGKLGKYDNKDAYHSKVSSELGYNHYSFFYGGDYGEIIYNFNNKKDNLLIFSNSYSNPINELIASSYNKTFVVDLRAYEEDLNKSFDFSEYVKNNNISKILFIGDIYFYTSDIFLINL